jgi:hypothetical protein
MQCPEKAGIEARTYDGSGRMIEHVDLHSRRRTWRRKGSDGSLTALRLRKG